MPNNLGFSSYDLVAFLATSKPDAARRFYRDTLGLRLVNETGFALVFDANGTTLRITIVPEPVVAGYTVLGWRVSDVREMAASLHAAGVELTRYDGMEQDELGVWTSPAGAHVAWFPDPDGNTLSVSDA